MLITASREFHPALKNTAEHFILFNLILFNLILFNLILFDLILFDLILLNPVCNNLFRISIQYIQTLFKTRSIIILRYIIPQYSGCNTGLIQL